MLPLYGLMANTFHFIEKLVQSSSVKDRVSADFKFEGVGKL